MLAFCADVTQVQQKGNEHSGTGNKIQVKLQVDSLWLSYPGFEINSSK